MGSVRMKAAPIIAAAADEKDRFEAGSSAFDPLPDIRRWYRKRGCVLIKRSCHPQEGRRNGGDILARAVFWLSNSASSSFFRSSARPFFSAASNAFMVGP